MKRRRQTGRARPVKKRRVGPSASYVRPSASSGTYYGATSELKFFDLSPVDAVVAINGTILEDSCNEIAAGTGEQNRIGRKVIIKSINWKWDLLKIAHASTASGSEYVRIILYLDKQCNGATAAVTDILETNNYLSFRNLGNVGRFDILMDKQVMINDTAGGGDGTTYQGTETALAQHFYKKCNIPIEFSSTTGAITEIRSNNLGILLLSRTGNLTAFTSRMRLRFSDK